MKTIVISIPDETKARRVALRTQGYTSNGYVRAVFERELAHKSKPRLPRESR